MPAAHTGAGVTVETTIEAWPNEGDTLADLVAKVRAAGNPILRIDRERGCVVMSQTSEAAARIIRPNDEGT